MIAKNEPQFCHKKIDLQLQYFKLSYFMVTGPSQNLTGNVMKIPLKNQVEMMGKYF